MNKPKLSLSGCYAATLTPFDRHDALDLGVTRAHTQWLVANGVEGLCPAGTTGEFLFLSEEEKRQVVRATVEAAQGQVPVLAGVWASRMEETVRLAQAAHDSGAQGVFLPTPIYYPADDAALVAWYETVAAASPLPVYAYNIPQYAANSLSLDVLETLFRSGTIAGVKDSTGSGERVGALVQRFGARGIVFAASDGFALEGRRLGADGFISAIANVAPSLFARLWNGDDSLQATVDMVRATLKTMGSIPALKYLAGRQGFHFGASRLPFASLSAEQKAALDALKGVLAALHETLQA